jgi:hypothetical protein
LAKGVNTARLSGSKAQQTDASRGDEVRTSKLQANKEWCLSHRWKPKLGKPGVMDSQ